MQIGSLELQVLVNDRPVREWGHNGLTYVAGHKGSRFTLKFRNNTAQRLLAIPSIDGLSAIDGQPATGASKGYIVPAYSSVEIKGWKQNLRETADFVFTDRNTTSYAAQTHGAQNCGIIALKVIAEKVVVATPVRHTIVHEYRHYPWWHYWTPPPPVWQPWPTVLYTTDCSTGNATGAQGRLMCSSDISNSSAGASQKYDACLNMADTAPQQVFLASTSVGETPDFALGTGYGQVREDVVSEASFERGLELATFEIYYSDEAALIAAGVPLNKAAQISKPVPKAFGGWATPPAVTV